MGAQGLAVRLDNLTLYRDLYYGTQAVGVRPPLTGAWRLAADEYFLLGDNAPVSLDSRRWGPVPRRLVVGKLLGSR
jgi:type IV secretory pathway protease TraF